MGCLLRDSASGPRARRRGRTERLRAVVEAQRGAQRVGPTGNCRSHRQHAGPAAHLGGDADLQYPGPVPGRRDRVRARAALSLLGTLHRRRCLECCGNQGRARAMEVGRQAHQGRLQGRKRAHLRRQQHGPRARHGRIHRADGPRRPVDRECPLRGGCGNLETPGRQAHILRRGQGR